MRGQPERVFFYFFFNTPQGLRDQLTFAQNLFCKVLGIDVKKNDGAKGDKPGYVQQVPLNFADVYVDERYMPGQGEYTDSNGNVIIGVSRVFKEDLPTFPYYSLVQAVADLTRKVNALEAQLLERDPEAAAKYVEKFPAGVPPTHQPMIPLQGDGNKDFRNISDFHWRNFGSNAEAEKQELSDRDDERYRKLSGGKDRREEEEEEEDSSEVPSPKRKTQRKKRNQRKKRQQQNKRKKEKEEKEEPPKAKVVPVARKTTLITEIDRECESSECEQEEQQEEALVIELPRGGKLNRELNALLAQELDGNHWAQSNQETAYAAAAIITGKRPYECPEEEEEDSHSVIEIEANSIVTGKRPYESPEEEEEDSHSVIEIDDDDEEQRRMLCDDLKDEVIILEEEDDDLGVQPMDQEEQAFSSSSSLFQYDPKTEALHFTPVCPGDGDFYDLAAKPSDQELDLMQLSEGVGAPLDLWGESCVF